MVAREYIAWIVIALLSLGLLLFGWFLNDQQRVVRLAVNSNDPVSVEVAQVVKSLLVKQEGLQAAIVTAASSEEAQQKILQEKADIALVLPAALTQLTGLKQIATVGELQANFIVRNRAKINSLVGIKAERLVLDGANPDNSKIFKTILQASVPEGWLEQSQNVTYDMVKNSDEVDGTLFFALGTDALTVRALEDKKLSFVKLPNEQMVRMSQFVANNDSRQQGMLNVGTLTTPVVLVSGVFLSDQIAMQINQALYSSQAKLSLARFDQQSAAKRRYASLLPEHDAVQRFKNPLLLNQYIANVVALFMDYRWFIFTGIILLVLIKIQLARSEKSRQQYQEDIITTKVRFMLNELFEIERQILDDSDLRNLKMVYAQVQRIKENGSQLLMKHQYFSQAQAQIFIEQCRFILTRLELQLGLVQQVKVATKSVA